MLGRIWTPYGEEDADRCRLRIYSLETQTNPKPVHVDAESSPLLNGDAEDPDKAFTNTLDTELERVVSFYELKENEICAELNALLKDEGSFEEHQDDYNEENHNAPEGGKMRSGSVFKVCRCRSALSAYTSCYANCDPSSSSTKPGSRRC
jgi:hypothetical protein